MSLTWEGHDLQPAHRRWRFWIAEGRDELPDVRSSSEVIPFRPGRLHTPGIADRRQLEVRGYVKEVTEPALRAELDLLKGLLDPQGEEPGILADDFEDGSVRWIAAIPRNVMPRYGGEFTRMLSIELEALDPFWYSSNGAAVMDDGDELDDPAVPDVLDGGAEVLLVPDGATSVEALSSTPVHAVRVVLVGPTDPGLVVQTDEGVGFTVPVALPSGDTLLVDEWAREVRLEGVFARDRIELLAANRHGEYFRLRRGITQITVTGAAAAARLLFQRTYL